MPGRKSLSKDELQQLFGENNSDTSTKSQLVSKFQFSMMLARFCVGSGLFSIPAAFRYSGILAGVIWVFINGFLMAHGMEKLAKLSEEISRRTGEIHVYYGDLGEECVKIIFNGKGGKIGRIVVNTAIALACFALVCTQIIYVADLWKQGFQELGVPELHISIWILIVYIFLFPLIQIRRPDALAVCSIIANIVTMIGTITIFVHIFSSKTLNHAKDWSENKVYWTKLPLTIGMTFYAYQLVAPFIVTVKNVMLEPKKITFIISIVIAIVTLLYGVMGAAGFASCFPQCKDSILLNLPKTWYYSIVKIFLGMASCVGTLLGMFVCFNIVENLLRIFFPENRFLVAAITTRIFVVTLAAGFTSAVPQLGHFMSLAGTLTNPVLSLIFPAIGHVTLFYETLSRTAFAKDIALFVIGLAILVTGLYTSFYHIIHNLVFAVPFRS